jgi:hypothetical protein
LRDARVSRVCWFEWPDPSVAVNVETGVAWLDDMARWKCSAANHVPHMLGENLFVADTILDGADGALLIENVRGLFDGAASVCAFCRDNAEIARRNFAGIRSRVETHSEIGGAADTQAAFIDCLCVALPNIVGMDFDVFEAGEVRAEDTSDCTAADNANLHAHAIFNASTPV